MFIVLESLDGVGKTTLTKGLAERLQGVAMNTPGKQLRQISNKILDGLGPNQEARCLFYASSVIAKGAEARRLVQAGNFAIMDRYWLSTISYARARGVHHSLHDIEAMIPRPDLTILLTLDESIRKKRLNKRGLTAADRETLDPTFREVVLTAMTDPNRVPGLQPQISIDLTGKSEDVAVSWVFQKILQFINGGMQRGDAGLRQTTLLVDRAAAMASSKAVQCTTRVRPAQKKGHDQRIPTDRFCSFNLESRETDWNGPAFRRRPAETETPSRRK